MRCLCQRPARVDPDGELPEEGTGRAGGPRPHPGELLELGVMSPAPQMARQVHRPPLPDALGPAKGARVGQRGPG